MEILNLDVCKYCRHTVQLADGRLLCKKKPLIKSVVQEDRKACYKYVYNHNKKLSDEEE